MSERKNTDDKKMMAGDKNKDKHDDRMPGDSKRAAPFNDSGNGNRDQGTSGKAGGAQRGAADVNKARDQQPPDSDV